MTELDKLKKLLDELLIGNELIFLLLMLLKQIYIQMMMEYMSMLLLLKMGKSIRSVVMWSREKQQRN